MIQKIDKGLIKAYKFMLINQLEKYEEWSDSGNDGEYQHYHNSSSSHLSFIVRKNNEVKIQINSDTIYTFKKMNNIDLYFKIIHFRKMKKHEKINMGIKYKEDRMRNALPDDYKRSVKISKIKSKI